MTTPRGRIPRATPTSPSTASRPSGWTSAGTGDSEGILLDEYLAQEQDDAVEVIAWIAEQPWCSGAVGMIGYSWGGFNGLQIAARRPPALKAVVSMHSTDDRYSDDCHYLGGAVLANDMLRWAHTMRAINALPPTPEVVGDRWREMWLERLERTPHFVEAWLTHQTYDDFWKQGSIREDYSAIEAATFVVGGWTDAYTNAVPRMLEHLRCPRAGLIGPWAHIFPERGVPGPAIGFLQECVAWFERWLNGRPIAADEWPLLRAWMQEPVQPAGFYAERPGRWLAVREWPPPARRTLRLGLTLAGELVRAERARRRGVRRATSTGRRPGRSRLSPTQSCGEAACVWCSNGLPDELAGDQRIDDARSLVFDSPPLAERLELLGRPEVALEVEATAPVGTVVARLCDVAPDGMSTLDHLRRAEPHPPERRREPRGTRAGRTLRRARAAQRDRTGCGGGPPAPARPVANLVADGVAAPGGRAARRGAGRLYALAARASPMMPRRKPTTRSSASARPRPRRRSSGWGRGPRGDAGSSATAPRA